MKLAMIESNDLDLEDWLSRLDLESVPDFDDKVRECEFFFESLAREVDRSKFRWLLSGFLNASYSFFESTALAAYFRFADESGNPFEDAEGLLAIRRHVAVVQPNKNNPKYVKTFGLTDLTKQLYEIRKKCTHHFSLSIMQVGDSLPEGFQLGNMRGEGIPIIPFCRDVLHLIQSIHAEINW